MKTITKLLIGEKLVNYPLTILIIYFLWKIIFNHFNEPDFIMVQRLGERGFAFFVLLLVGIIVYGTSIKQVMSLKKAEVMFLGVGTGCWLTEGKYFLWFGIFTLRPGETQDLENRNAKILGYECRDINGKKLLMDLDGDYEIIDSHKFMKFKEEEMQDNVEELLKRVTVKVTGSLDFKDDIIGQDLGDKFITEPKFVATCKDRYGIKFIALDPSVKSGNLNQDDLNQYRKTITKDLKELYPNLPDKEISEMVEVQLKLIKKISFKGGSQATPLVRVDGDS